MILQVVYWPRITIWHTYDSSDMLCSFLCVDVVSLSECKPVLQPMFDFTPNENGCTVVRMKRGSKPRGKIYSTNKAAAAAAAAQAPSP